jgi:polar amino acid transport system substrate-binding protein
MYKTLAALILAAWTFAAFAQPAGGPTARGSTVTPVSPEVLKELAPTGKLRAALNMGNGVLVQGPPEDPRGVTVDLSRS